MSPDGGCNLSGKVSNLEMQLEIETRQTEEARTKVETLDAVVAELQLQLQTEARQTQEALEKMQTAEQRAGEVELQLQLQTEAQQKQEANEEVELLKLRVADLEKQLDEQSHTPSDADEQVCCVFFFEYTCSLVCRVNGEILKNTRIVASASCELLGANLQTLFSR